MSITYKKQVDAYPSIYAPKPRKMEIIYDEPENGINENTGMLLFIGGYGTNHDNYYFKKFRKNFANRDNLIVLQCKYFGYNTMSNSTAHIAVTKNMYNYLAPKAELFMRGDDVDNEMIHQLIQPNLSSIMEPEFMESLNEFDDGGIMQAIDNISAVLYVLNFYRQKGIAINRNKIISFGTSHGAYLAYLANAFANGLFSMVIDNSSYLYAHTMQNHYIFNINNKRIFLSTNKLRASIERDMELLDLRKLYYNSKNIAKIYCFHGTSDKYVKSSLKQSFCDSIDNCIYNEIDEQKVDGIIFNSTNHADVNLSRLLKYVLEKTTNDFAEHPFQVDNFSYSTSLYNYEINYDEGMPFFSAESKTGKSIYKSFK